MTVRTPPPFFSKFKFMKSHCKISKKDLENPLYPWKTKLFLGPPSPEIKKIWILACCLGAYTFINFCHYKNPDEIHDLSFFSFIKTIIALTNTVNYCIAVRKPPNKKQTANKPIHYLKQSISK